MLRRAVIAAVAAGALLAVALPLASAQQETFNASLDGYQEVPAISTTGSGEFQAQLDPNRDQIIYRLRYQGVESPAFASHIHFAQEGVNGGIIAWLCGGGGKPACPPQGGEVRGRIRPSDIIGPSGQGIASGEFDEAVAAMRAGVTYANVHTDQFPGGEIRGQINANG